MCLNKLMKKGIKIFLVFVFCIAMFSSGKLFAANALTITETSNGVTITGGGQTFNYSKDDFTKYFGQVSSFTNNTITEKDLKNSSTILYLEKMKTAIKNVEKLPNRYTNAQCYEKKAVEFLNELLDIIDEFKSINDIDAYYTTNLYNKTSGCGDFEQDYVKTTFNNAIAESKGVITEYLTFKSNFESLNYNADADKEDNNDKEDDDSDKYLDSDITVNPGGYQNGITPDGNFRPVKPNNTANTIGGIITGTNKIWSSILLIVQIVSVASVVIAGLRYMFASADKKAEIKKGIMYLMFGAIFVFAASTVIKFVYNIWQDLIK